MIGAKLMQEVQEVPGAVAKALTHQMCVTSCFGRWRAKRWAAQFQRNRGGAEGSLGSAPKPAIAGRLTDDDAGCRAVDLLIGRAEVGVAGGMAVTELLLPPLSPEFTVLRRTAASAARAGALGDGRRAGVSEGFFIQSSIPSSV